MLRYAFCCVCFKCLGNGECCCRSKYCAGCDGVEACRFGGTGRSGIRDDGGSATEPAFAGRQRAVPGERRSAALHAGCARGPRGQVNTRQEHDPFSDAGGRHTHSAGTGARSLPLTVSGWAARSWHTSGKVPPSLLTRRRLMKRGKVYSITVAYSGRPKEVGRFGGMVFSKDPAGGHGL